MIIGRNHLQESISMRIGQKDLYSFRPAMAYMLDTMIDYPNVEIYFLLNDGLGEEISELSERFANIIR